MRNKRQKSKFFNYNFFPKNRKALSGVVMMVIMIALVMVIMAVVVTMTKKTVEKKIEQTEACGIDNFGKLSINSEFVCYDSTNSEFVFSINREDIDLDKLLISISSETESQTFEMRSKVDEDFGGKIVSYPDRSTKVRLPGKNSGKTYILTEFSDQVTDIKIAPVISGKQCDVIDTLSNIVDCSITTILS